MNLHSILSNLYPENSPQGQCGDFAHRLIEFGSVGDGFSEKKKAVQNYGLLKCNLQCFHVGDVVITSDGTFMGFGHGHVFVVMNQDKDFLYAAESNFRLDGRVHYGRKISKTDSKIYGVIRGKFKFSLGIDILKFKIAFLMQYQKQWDSKCFGQVTDRIRAVFKGKLVVNPFPLYTYNSLKNWDYKYFGSGYGDYFKLISQEYFNDIVMPLAGDAEAVVWCINKQQWQGSVLDHPDTQEIGWYYRPSLPGQITLACEESDISPVDPGESLFVDGVFHELSHLFYAYGRADQVDNTHNRHFGWNGFPKNLESVAEDIDLTRLIANL